MEVEGDFTCEICGESFTRNVDIAGHVRGHELTLSSESVIFELQQAADSIGRTPTEPEFNAEAECTSGAVESHFGSWREGVKAAGLTPLCHTLSDEDILEELHRVAEELGHSPSANEMNEVGSIASSSVKNHFGSWNEGLRAAGLDTHVNAEVSREETIQAIRTLGDELGRVPTAYEMDEHGKYSTKIAQRLFTSWNQALEAAGFSPNVRRNIPEIELVAEIKRLAGELGHTPSSIELKEHGRFSLVPYRNRYGSWAEAVEAAGLEHRGQPSGPNHPTWKGGYGDISYGPNWYLQRKRALERDDFSCQMPSCQIDRKLHRKLFDRDLSVHHIIPLGEYVDADGVLDYEGANSLNNLITLCQRHHPYWEQLTPLRPDTR